MSNEWDDATAALQLLSHLEGDTLNAALLVPESKQATWAGLVGALSAHYGSPGRLADLETLADKAFGDISRLRIIRDHFIAGHNCCELGHHLDSVAPETPIQNIVDRCWVWESHADSDNRRVGRPVPEKALPIYTVSDANGGGVGRVATAVPASPTRPDQLERLLRRLLPTQVLPTPPPKPVPSD